MWIWLLLRTWFSQITAVVWLTLAFVSFIVEISVPHFGFAFVGAGAVVAAGAVVTSSVEHHTIVAGVPARAIGQVPQASS